MAIVSATKNRILVRIVKSFYELSRARREIYFSDHERSKRAYEDHTGILKCSIRGTPHVRCREKNDTTSVTGPGDLADPA